MTLLYLTEACKRPACDEDALPHDLTRLPKAGFRRIGRCGFVISSGGLQPDLASRPRVRGSQLEQTRDIRCRSVASTCLTRERPTYLVSNVEEHR
jgi:hypothetical protein